MRRATVFAVETVLLLGFWLLLSGRLEPLFLGMGIASALLVSALTADFLAGAFAERSLPLVTLPLRAWRFGRYLVWLVLRIVVSSTQVAYLVCRPSMPLDPGMVRLRTQLHSPMARTFLANTITLIPGTMTVSLDGDELTVHVLWPEAVDDLASGRMQDVIGRVFLDRPQPPAELVWETPTSEGPYARKVTT